MSEAKPEDSGGGRGGHKKKALASKYDAYKVSQRYLEIGQGQLPASWLWQSEFPCIPAKIFLLVGCDLAS